MVLEIFPLATKDIVVGLGQIALWLQAIGIIALILVISSIIRLILLIKSKKKEKALTKKLDEIEKKLDRLLNKK